MISLSSFHHLGGLANWHLAHQSLVPHPLGLRLMAKKAKKTTFKNQTKKKKTAAKRVAADQVIRRTYFGARVDDEVKEIRQAADPLLRGLVEPTLNTYECAKKTINDLVVVSDDPIKTEGDKASFVLSVALSAKHLPGYATLDKNHIEQITQVIAHIERYIDDASQRRPLNVLMLASPGAGKSQIIKCIADRLERKKVGAITYNMTGLQASEDLIPPLDAARNLKVNDRLPLLFLDEFDSRPENYSLLLPLLWDGEVTIGQRDLKLGKVVIVLAGSDPSLPKIMEQAQGMRPQVAVPDSSTPKLVDLFSRINGGILAIPNFYDKLSETDRRADKVCIAIHLLRKRFGESLTSVPTALLRFIARVNFRYGVRSIAHLIDSIPYRENVAQLTRLQLKLPLNDHKLLKESSLAYHMFHEDHALGIVRDWTAAWKADSSNVMICAAAVDYVRRWRMDDESIAFLVRDLALEFKGIRRRRFVSRF